MSRNSASQSLELYKTIFENSSDAILLTTPENEILDVNSTFEEILGYSKDQVIHKELNDLFPEISSILNELKVEKLSVETVIPDKKGKNIFCQISSIASEENDSKFNIIFIKNLTTLKNTQNSLNASEDITDLKLANESLKASEEKFLKAFQDNPAAMTIADQEGKFIDVNKAFSKLTGYTKEEAVGRTSGELNLIDVKKRQNYTDKLKEKGRMHETEFEMFTKSGEKRIISLMSKPFELAGEIKFISYIHDLTLRKQMEAELRESDRKLNLALNSAKAGNWEWNLISNENSWSSQIWELYGLEPQSIEPSYEAWRQSIHPDYRDIVEKAVKEASDGGKELYIEWKVNSPDERWLMSRGNPIRDDNGKIVRYSGIVVDISELKLLEAAKDDLFLETRQSKEELETLIDNIVDEVWFCDEKGNILLANTAARKFEEKLSANTRSIKGIIQKVEVYDAEGNPRPQEDSPLLRALKGDLIKDLDEIVVFPDKYRQYRQVSSSPIHDDKNKIIGAVAVVRDVTEHRKIEESLKKSESKYRGLFDNLPLTANLMRYVLNEDGEVIDWVFEDINFQTQKLLGKSFAELKGHSLMEIMGQDHMEQFLPTVNEMRNTGSLLTQESHLKEMDLYHITTFAPMTNELFLSIDMDITELKNTEKRLKNSLKDEKFLGDIVRNASIAIGTGYPDGRLGMFNKAFEELTGYSKEELYSMDWSVKLTPEKWRKNEQKYLDKLLKTKRPIQYEKEYIKKDGSIVPIELVVYPRLNNKGEFEYYVSFIKDITERKKSEITLKKHAKELEKTIEELNRSNEDLERFAYIASHDLQEPLRSVSGFLQLLVRRYEDELNPKAQQYVDISVNGVIRMQAMIEDLLQFSRVSTKGKEFQIIDSNKVLEEVLLDLKAMINENKATVTYDKLPMILADDSQIPQVFQNLISNAIKFHSEELPQIHVSAQEEDHQWIFSVADNGIGIDPQYHEQIFEVFRRLHTRQKYEGTGIGLAVVRKIIERHGGKIWIKSELGKGSIFYFTIPKGGKT